MTQPSTVRRVICWAAIASASPYLVLKLLWVSGSTVGITDRAFAEDGSLLALNLLTMVLDAVAIALVLAFTFPWGRRLPGWLLLPPIFVGCGLLGPIVVGAPAAAVITPLAGGDPVTSTDNALPLADWVVPLVYGGFVLLGVLLLTAFVLYAAERWRPVFHDVTPVLTRGEWALAIGGSLVALAAAGLLLADAAEPDAVVASAVTLAVVKAVLALAAVAGVGLLHPAGRRRFRLPMLAVWFGSSALLAWGGWSLLNVVAETALVAGETGPREVVGGLAQLLGGLLLATVLLRALRRVTGAAARG